MTQKSQTMKTRPIRSEQRQIRGGGGPASFASPVLVAGGGAAGMLLALLLAKAGIPVELFEKNERLGRKLAITGKGRCNLTNLAERESFFSNIISNPKFFFSAYSALPPKACVSLFESLGVPLKEERGKRVYPCSDRAADVVAALEKGIKAAGVRVHRRTTVRKILLEKGKIKGLLCETEGKRFEREGQNVILATGGLSYPLTGSTGDGYRMAQSCGHSVTELYPALVPMECREAFCAELAGLAPKNVRFTVRSAEDGKKVLFSEFGEMLFTHFGVSGPLVLSASSYLASTLAQKTLRAGIDWKPYLTEEKLDAEVLALLTGGSKKQLRHALAPLYPKSLLPVLLRLAELPEERPANSLTRSERRRIVSLTKDFPLELTGTRGYAEAVVTQGGISVKEVDPKSFESKRVEGLYLIGELLDLDALTGGFNLQIAWSTAAACAQALIRKYEKEAKEKKMKIAIDGPAGAGKSTIAKAIAKKLGFTYVDTGAVFRALAIRALEKEADPADEESVMSALDGVAVDLRYENGEQHVYLDGEDVTGSLRTETVGNTASAISVHPRVRDLVLIQERKIADTPSVVMDGRDIGTVVLPDAECKIFLTASVEARAQRRYQELIARGETADLEAIREDLRTRDDRDANRPVAPLKQAEDAYFLDSSEKDIGAVLAEALSYVESCR